MNLEKASIMWFRRDFRLSDNPALSAAAKHKSVLPIYLMEPDCEIGSASKWRRNKSLQYLSKKLDANLEIHFDSPEEALIKLCKKNQINDIYINRVYEPEALNIEKKLKSLLAASNINLHISEAQLLWLPNEILKSDLTPYKVFTPLYKNGYLKAKLPRKPLPKPVKIIFFKTDNKENQSSNLTFEAWAKKFDPQVKFGEEAAQKQLNYFLSQSSANYETARDEPSSEGTSALSTYLHFGEISPHQIWWKSYPKNEPFLREIAWREFSYYLLYHFPSLPNLEFNTKFRDFPWKSNQDKLKKWQMGQTGVPLVDAGMRELWQTGLMHNRIRMVVASYLVKNLGVDWRHGADWFMECLLDADLAANSFNWQWVAGCGVDAAPYFRIFNPVLQGEKFDSLGDYTRKYLPELSKLPLKYLFKPWEAPDRILKDAAITLGKNYPQAIVDLQESRKEALRLYKAL